MCKSGPQSLGLMNTQITHPGTAPPGRFFHARCPGFRNRLVGQRTAPVAEPEYVLTCLPNMSISDQYPNLLPQQGTVFLLEGVYSPAECILLQEKLLATVPWKQEPIIMFGKKIMQPRLTAWFAHPGKTYRYSGITMIPAPWNELLTGIRQRVTDRTGMVFNSVLLNLYRNGDDSMGWHRDNEKELGPNPAIASLSFGATREFRMRLYQDKQLEQKISLCAGSLLLMSGQSQQYWEHALPKRAGLTEPRLNLTFRYIV